MPIPTPLHPRTAAASHSFLWKEWAGYAAVRSYDAHSEAEYHGVRHAAGILDVSPLYKYDIRGRDAARVLSYLFSRDIAALAVGRVTYACLLDDHGKVLDDGTVSRMGDDWFRVTSSEPWRSWFLEHSVRRDVSVEDITHSQAAMAVQGPRARAILAAIWPDVEKLGFFRTVTVDGAVITRTGYTGDLGYEVWVPPDRACETWDRIMAAGAPHQITPFGLDALDVLRIEAGFVLQGVDYVSARSTLLARRKSTPDEIGLGWTVDLDRDGFLGQAAIKKERAAGPAWGLVGLELDWVGLEALYATYDLPPYLAPIASRESVPVFDLGGKQVGYATSRTWSPLCKRYLALATVQGAVAKKGTKLLIEHTPEFERKTVACTVVDKPFYDPPHKRSTPGAKAAKQGAK